MYNDDIPMSRSKTVKVISKVPIDQTLEKVEFEVQKFVKDPLNINDIDGSTPHWRQNMKIKKAKETMQNSRYELPPVTSKL